MSRILTVALMLALAITVPVVASAGECQFTVISFEVNKDVLEVVSLDDTTAHNILFLFYLNDGTFVRDTQITPALGPNARTRVTAKQVYATWGADPPSYNDSYVKMRLAAFAPFTATLTNGGVTRELGCISIP